ncbi:sigma-70 family RNA polymerase sigma factor [Neobacillus sp. D3-1R]|uniref:sigma-70 family RNA polymerase sigma factor n=1 Tax=Neobacillus sp. D3-1R TaxID=3445778 RepID=UPI003FA1669D
MDEKRKQTLDDIYRKYAEGLYYYLLHLSGSPSVAEELVQETFYRATISLSFFKDEEVKPWLYKIARNAYIDEWRKRQRWKWVPFFEKEEMKSPYGIPEEEILLKETKQIVADLLDLLPENYRTILYFREYENFSYTQIQEAMNLNESQVKVMLHRTRKRLAELSDRMKGVKDEDGLDE